MKDKPKILPAKELADLLQDFKLLKESKAHYKQALAILRDSETRYRRLFETAQDGILILNAETGRITDVNPFLMDMLGYSYKEFIGKRLWEIGLFKDVPQSRKAFTE